MLSREKIEYYNEIVLLRLSEFLNNNSNFINKKMIDNLVQETNLSVLEAYKYLLVEMLGLSNNRELFEYYFNDIVHQLDTHKYINNPYYKNINIENINYGKYKYIKEKYESYEAFVFNDLKVLSDGRVIPQIGFFTSNYYYPAILENGREWMLITPNEIETMDKIIKEAHGNVATYGLGLGYFPYMVSLKNDVESITIVEKDKNIINLFNKYILPQFKYKEKIKIVNEDAFIFAKKHIFKYNFVFIDIWHDPSDGIDMYLKFKKLEKKNITYKYWIEDTIKYYL